MPVHAECRPAPSTQPQRTHQTHAQPAAVSQLATADFDRRPEAPLQARFAELAHSSPRSAQQTAIQACADTSPQSYKRTQLAAATPNRTGLPDKLKAGIESLSGLSMDHVRVHYNSSQPTQLNALAYAQGSDIHIAPGQEKHLPHEAWHIVQQAQGRVQRTMQMKNGVPVNDDARLEREADVMGARALALAAQRASGPEEKNLLQGKFTPVCPVSPIQAVWNVKGNMVGRQNLQTDPILALVNEGFFTQQQAQTLPLEVVLRIHQTLDSQSTFLIELLVNQVLDFMHKLSDPTPDEGMGDEGHLEDEGDAPLQDVNPEDIPAIMLDTLQNQIPFMPIIQDVRKRHGDAIAIRTMELWYSSGVVTRSKFAELVKLAYSQILGENAQFKRGAGPSGPSSYTGSSNSHFYVNVTYTRNGDGYFDFASPTSQTSWKNPINGSWCDLQSSCIVKRWGLMPSGGKIELAKGSRAQHFAIANKLTGIGVGGNSPSNLTWHHLMPEYQMILVDRQVHRKHGHNGGKFLWK